MMLRVLNVFNKLCEFLMLKTILLACHTNTNGWQKLVFICGVDGRRVGMGGPEEGAREYQYGEVKQNVLGSDIIIVE